MCKLGNTIFVEKEGIVLAYLQRRRKSECETTYEKPKQEKGLA